jgi:dynein heavy chain
MFVMGGIDSSNNTLSDFHILNLRRMTWVPAPDTAKLPRAISMFSAVAVESAGTHKVFIFGGQTSSIMNFTNKVCFLNTLTMEWKEVKIASGRPPPVCADCSMLYDVVTGKLLVFGGAGNEHIEGVFFLDTSAIVGPPYAMFKLNPPMGPLHGGMLCAISGQDFYQSDTIQVQLTDGKKEVAVPGVFKSEDIIEFVTPDLAPLGDRPIEVNVRVSLEASTGFTVNDVTFALYLDTSAPHCLAYGPALRKVQATGQQSSFMIFAKNLAGQDRTHGGDVFEVRISAVKSDEQIAAEEAAKAAAAAKLQQQQGGGAGGRRGGGGAAAAAQSQPSTPKAGASKGGKAQQQQQQQQADEDEEDDQNAAANAQSSSSAGGDGFKVFEPVEPVIVDLNNGKYEVIYKVMQEGEYVIDVTYQGKPVRGTPFHAEFRDRHPDPYAGQYIGEGERRSNFLPVMKNEVPLRLAALEAAVNQYESTLAMQVTAGKVHTLIKVMSCIEELATVTEAIELELDCLRETTAYLRASHDLQADAHRKRLKAIVASFARVREAVPAVEKELAIHKSKAKVDIRAKIDAFVVRVGKYAESLDRKPYFEYSFPLADVYLELDAARTEMAQNEHLCEELLHLATLFSFTAVIAPAVDKLKACAHELRIVKQLWDLIDLIRGQLEEWKQVTWPHLQPEVMEVRVRELAKDLKGVDRKMKDTDAFMEISAIVKNFQQSCPLVVNLRHESMRERHWAQLMDKTGVRFVVNDKFSLADLIALNLPQYESEVDAIVDRALKEEKMEKSLAKLKDIWSQTRFSFSQHQDTDIKLVKVSEEDYEQLENDQLVVQSMMGSKYLFTFEEQVTGWKRGLQGVERVVNIWAEIQRTWAYLVNLFIGSVEVKRDLPEDSERFIGIDKEVTDFLKLAVAHPNVYETCNRVRLFEGFESIQKRLELCEKSLFEYLDSKRMAFPRFFFVSTTDLLDILCNGNIPSKVMVHMAKIFQAIKRLDLEGGGQGQANPTAKAIISAVGEETVKLTKPLVLQGKVESYLMDTIGAMTSTMRAVLKASVATYQTKPREQWLVDEPNQVVLVTTQIVWTTEIIRALEAVGRGERDALRKYRDKQKGQIDRLIDLVCGDLTKALRQKIMVLITLDTHALDVTDALIKEDVASVTHFRWQSQLRYRWDEQEDTCVTNICDAAFRYGYEYLGNGPRLVITALTDRIYITASQSLHLKLGCAPAGPAGTGKTETTKDLASQLGKACYVFNCSDQMDYKGMGNIFKGLAASGSWGCFDEFNRLVPEVLSVCSQQFSAVLSSIREAAKTFTVEGVTLSLDPTCGVFITMNPGYLGRTELPETLKTLFRPITVVVPDLAQICENMLMAEGFKQAKLLARKFTTLYALLRDLLSKQDHYDWGLRAIKSVLMVAGAFKRAEPQIEEADLLMRALRDSNLAKIPTEDVPVFMGLIGDLFPGTSVPRRRDLELEKAVRDVCQDKAQWPDLAGRALTPEEGFMLKVVQLDELLVIRHSVFIIGTSGTAKSAVWATLAKAWTKMGRPTTVRDLNPKSITANELYGYVELATREWKDGLLSNIMRELASVPDTDPKWIILDGDLDTNWIESMNSVMDDNRILTLASNERIPLHPHMRLIFEIRDLKYASPATVSRAGIIFMSESQQWLSYVKSWIAARVQDSPEQQALLLELFGKYVPETIRHLVKNFKHVVPVLPFNMVQSLCHLLEGLLDGVAAKERLNSLSLETYFVFAAVWAFGSALNKKDNVDYRVHFSDWWKDEYKGVKFPGRSSVFDVFVDPEQGHRFVQWRSIVEEIEFDSRETEMSSVNVPIAETTSVAYFMRQLMDRRRPVMLVGNAGCGKTALAMGLLQKLIKENKDTLMSVNISLNYYTDSMTLQRSLEDPLEKKAGRSFGPPGNKKLVYFVDDLNMPMLDAYNTQTPISLMRQHIDYAHWYDREKLSHSNLKKIENTQYVCAMNPTAGSFVINPRLQRHFVVFSLDLPSPGSLMDIYKTFLAGHFAPFPTDIQEMCVKLVHSALLLHSRVGETFRKTAVNFHYEFNMRHIANVFAGLLQSAPPQFSGEGGARKMCELWLHESERVYCDRLVSASDIKAYGKVAKEVTMKFWAQFNLNHLFEEKSKPALIFSHFAGGLIEKHYDRAASRESIKAVLEEALNEYNEENARMNLLLFDDAVKHVCRIARIIESPGGHALLVGVGGSGKQSLSRLAAHTCGYAVYQITISSSYGMNDLRDDLKSLYLRTGTKKMEGVLFLLTEGQITNERFLVYINDLLASGEIPDLFTLEEKDQIVSAVRVNVKSSGLEDTRDNCWDFFMAKVKANLHVALCFSPIGDAFRVRLRRFPALVNCTVIDWFHPWPKDALLGVAKRFLADVDLGDEAVREGVTNFMPFSYEMVNKVAEEYLLQARRHYHTTPKSYLELIALFKQMLQTKRTDLRATITRLENGLAKLEVTSRDVDKLQEELKVRSVEVEEKKLAAEVFADQVGREKAIVEAESEKAAIEAENCEKIQVEVSAKRAICERELAAAEPLVERAQAALNTLNKKELTEMKALQRPPAGVDDVMIAVMILLAPRAAGVPKPEKRTWPNAVLLMAKVDTFLATLLDFKSQIDQQNVNPKNFAEVRPYLRKEHFNRDAISVKSKAAAGICEWVVNIVEYYDIFCKVEPMRVALADAESQLAVANHKLTTIKATVAELEEQLGKLLSEYEVAEREKQKMIDEVNFYQRKLDLAHRLISALESESVRWKAGVVNLNKDLSVVVGDVLVSSAFVSYIGGFSKKYRDMLVSQHWIPFLKENKVPMSPSSDVLRILTTDSQVATWQNQGLPADRVSTENATIVANAERWPLIIDPQLQGVGWLKEKCGKDLVVLRLGQKGLVHTMENAIANGQTVLIENIGVTIDAVLGPVVARQIIRKLGINYMKLGDKEVEHNPEFQLYLHTKLSNPHYPPEIQAETTLINFAVTEAGLEDQMLAIVVRRERPELEERKSALIKQQNEFKIKLKELEDDLLSKLATAQGDLTENLPLIENLEESKRLASEIFEKVRVAQETEKKINAARELYRPVARRASLMFFLLSDLRKINAYYEYSLTAFVDVFCRGIDNLNLKKKAEAKAARAAARAKAAGKPGSAAAAAAAAAAATGDDSDDERRADSDDEAGSSADVNMNDPEVVAALKKRIAELIESTTYAVFSYTRRSLFDRHRLIFAAQVCLSIQEREGKLDPAEVDFLVKGLKKYGTRPDRERLQRFLPEPVWAAIMALEECENFAKLSQDISKNADAWEKWASEEQPEAQDLPRDAKGPVRSGFQKLCVIRAMRPDRMTTAMRDYVRTSMGDHYVDQEAFNLKDIFAESNKVTPIMFILFPGAQPVKDVEAMAKERKVKLKTISMGQGQEPAAEAAFREMSTEGGWLFLDNVHLMSAWLPVLERLLEGLQESGHQDFRFFFSAEPSANPLVSAVPESILQASIKLVNEPPSDLKSNLRRAYAQFSQTTLDRSSKPTAFKPTLFALCFFHAVVLGRRKFGWPGWSRHYSFNMGDLTICADVLHNYIEASPTGVPWDDLRYMFGEIMYGGHITDYWDRRTCNTYLEVLLKPELFSAMELAPGFKCPDGNNEYIFYRNYIDHSLPSKETPTMFGLHNNAEITFMNTEGEVLFATILDLKGATGGSGALSKEVVVLKTVEDILGALPPEFSMLEILERVTERTPSVVVVLQEVDRMNSLLAEISRSLTECKLGLTGALNISEQMEMVTDSLFLNRVPPGWAGVSYPSLKPLAAWVADLHKRIGQLVGWAKTLTPPVVTWLGGLFSPMAFLTAVVQTSSRASQTPLDSMTILTTVTKTYAHDAAAAALERPAIGALVSGLFLEGCRWDEEEGQLTLSRPKELTVELPVIHVTAVRVESLPEKGVYVCPVYTTQMRGPHFLFKALLPTDEDPSTWVLAGGAAVLSLST